uniref:Uncharacterized protein n=1 Tax=Rousettus aegyptiacus TaxID=9407 RepID=A0A7J8KAJ6_ROUAE|nr:hypothetical protein HJG63_007707 [Rousettus aegyptiacus]
MALSCPGATGQLPTPQRSGCWARSPAGVFAAQDAAYHPSGGLGTRIPTCTPGWPEAHPHLPDRQREAPGAAGTGSHQEAPVPASGQEQPLCLHPADVGVKPPGMGTASRPLWGVWGHWLCKPQPRLTPNPQRRLHAEHPRGCAVAPSSCLLWPLRGV